jgi:mitochondrial fission protein ELM1
VQHNLREAVGLFESFIKENPAEYLWTYKVWKYSDQRNILILSDAKAGHLRQAESLAGTVAGCLKDKGLKVSIETVEVKLKNRFSKVGLLFSSFFAGKYACQGCSWCLKSFLEAGTYNKIISVNPDIIISAGSGVTPVNYVVSRECLAKSLVIMKPQFLSPGKFNLLVIPKHDNPPVRKNVCIINGALNLINETYLKDQAEKLRARIAHHLSGKVIGLLMGGDTKNFAITENMINELIRQIKSACENLDADILVTTSRRSSPKIEKLLKDAFGDYPRCRLLIVANENNIPEAVGGILGLSTFLVTSPESISMLSEAASSGKVTFVFSACGLSRKHANFLDSLTRNNFVKAVRVSDIASHIIDAAENNAKMAVLDNNEKVIRSLGKVL